MTDDSYRAIWESYAAAWKAPTAEVKRTLLEKSTHADCRYTDPLGQKIGHSDLIAYMIEFHQQTPGGHFVTRHFQFHHGRSIVVWDMVDGAGVKLGEGMSYGEYADDGRLKSMTGFFETPDAP